MACSTNALVLGLPHYVCSHPCILLCVYLVLFDAFLGSIDGTMKQGLCCRSVLTMAAQMAAAIPTFQK